MVPWLYSASCPPISQPWAPSRSSAAFATLPPKLYNASNFLFHLKYDFSKFEYINTVTVCNRNCNKYRFKENINGTLATFNVYIDQATGFCLKGVCVIDDETKIYFETKRFISEPNINNYFNAINEYEAKN